MEGGNGKDNITKKARTFDFMAMFHEARKTALERIGPSITDSTNTVDLELNNDQDGLEAAKKNSIRTQDLTDGKSFESKNVRQCERLVDDGTNKIKELEESSDEDYSPPLPPGFKPFSAAVSNQERSLSTQQLISHNTVIDENDSEEESEIGPTLPPGFKPAVTTFPSSFQSTESLETDSERQNEDKSETNMMKTRIEKLSDDEDDDDADTEDDNPLNKIPTSHEIVLEHGHKTITKVIKRRSRQDPNRIRI